MIDPHVHLRDGENQSHKETVRHGLAVAYNSGLDAVFEMPNTDPPLTSRKTIEDRLRLGSEAKKAEHLAMFHGVYAGVTADAAQIKEVVALKYHNTRVVGLKMFAGHSTGNMGIIEEKEQRRVYKTLAELGYNGVLAVHCEKESELKPKLWNPEGSFTHTLARPPESEVESVKDQIQFAFEAGYKGILHICHVSVPESVNSIEMVRSKVRFPITCGATPHHCMLYDTMMEGEDGLLLKMNPPLRPKEMADGILKMLMDGRIDWIETDHAPHDLDEKTGKALDKDGKPIYASGIPVLPYYMTFLKHLLAKGMHPDRLRAVTHDNIAKAFRIDVPNSKRETLRDLTREYQFDPFAKVRTL
jgi:dihydroorotase